jgi:hypothetical protein
MKAFPHSYKHPHTGLFVEEPGMDLRDYFAGLAMQTLINKLLDGCNEVDDKCLAHDAYYFAELMLQQKERMEAGDE